MYNNWHITNAQKQISTRTPKNNKKQHDKRNKNNHFAIYLKKTLTFLYFQKTLYYFCNKER